MADLAWQMHGKSFTGIFLSIRSDNNRMVFAEPATRIQAQNYRIIIQPELKKNWQVVKTNVPPAVTAEAAKALKELPSVEGASRTVEIGGKKYLFRVETHTWYGADRTKPEKPHKGITVYTEKP